MSLISAFEKSQEEMIYSIHLSVRSWVRERISRFGNKAIWCEEAAQALTQCIVLEAKAFEGQTPEYFDAGQLLPHINSVREFQAHIENKFAQRRKGRKGLSWRPESTYGRPQMARKAYGIRLTKFSLVYKKCGEYKEAAELRRKVREGAISSLGMDNELTIKISLALAETWSNLGEFTKACDVQQEVIQACKDLYGADQSETLVNTDRLGLLLLRHGRLSKFLKRHKEALDGLTELQSKLEENFRHVKAPSVPYRDRHNRLVKKLRRHQLIAQSHLGAVEARYLRWEESKILIEPALKGLSDLDKEDDEVLWAMENLAFPCSELQDYASKEQAYELILQVRKIREEKLGKQHPLTLWAWYNLGRAQWKSGNSTEARECVDFALSNGERILGKSHFGVLAAKTVKAGDYDEAHDTLTWLDSEFEKIRQERQVDHLDRIVALSLQIDLSELQQRYTEALAAGYKVLDLLQKINSDGLGEKHPFYARLEKQIQKIEEVASADKVSGDSIPEPEAGLRQRAIKREGQGLLGRDESLIAADPRTG